MADLTQTAANVGLATSEDSPTLKTVQAGEAITQGMPVYKKTSDSKHYQCEADQGENEADCLGIALTPADANGYFVMAENGTKLDLGATLTIGEVYTVSANKGGICPESDLVSTNMVTTLGIADAADSLPLDINASSIAKA